MSDSLSVANSLGQVDVVRNDVIVPQREMQQQQQATVRDGPVPVSYTHLKLPTNREV